MPVQFFDVNCKYNIASAWMCVPWLLVLDLRMVVFTFLLHSMGWCTKNVVEFYCFSLLTPVEQQDTISLFFCVCRTHTQLWL